MAMNPFPPQAYTKDTVVRAYQWLQTQNPSIREVATTPDLLVSLYLKAQTQGADALDRPSLHSFKSELKNLAGMIGEFETTSAAEALTEASLASMGNAHSTNSSSSANPNPGLYSSPPPSPQSHPIPPAGASARNEPHSPHRAQPQNAHAPQTAGVELDPRSKQLVREIRERFNLSNDHEALRLLIMIGARKLLRFSEV